MNLWESFRTALASLVANKLRSVLTVLGIIIGVGAVIALQSIGQGFIESEQKSLESTGTNIVAVQPKGAYALTLEDMQAVSDPLNVPSAAVVGPEISYGAEIAVGTTHIFTRVLGAGAQFPQLYEALQLAAGDWFGEEDVIAAHPVVILGARVAIDLFGKPEAALGQRLQIERNSFTVAGVIAPVEQGFPDKQLVVPYTTMKKLFTGKRPIGAPLTGSVIDAIVIKAISRTEVPNVVRQTQELLRDRHQLVDKAADDFEIFTQADLLKQAENQFASLNIFLVIVASITLLVGGIGVMNIMLVTVTERVREIGIRKAMGAKPLDILLQFIVESMVLSMVGGALGMIAGIGSSLAIGAANLSIANSELHPVVSPLIVLLALGAALSVGLFFGIYPARRAARLSPMEALRYE